MDKIEQAVLAEVATEDLYKNEIARELNLKLSVTGEALNSLRRAGLAEKVMGSIRYRATKAGHEKIRRELGKT